MVDRKTILTHAVASGPVRGPPPEQDAKGESVEQSLHLQVVHSERKRLTFER